MNLTYLGRRLDSVQQVTFEMAMTEVGKSWADAFPISEREMRVDLPHGNRWPDEMKRGRPVIFDVNGHRFDGRIAWRRMHRLVVKGTFR